MAHTEAKRKVLVLTPSLNSIGGIQKYTTDLLNAFRIVLGSDCVRVVSVKRDPVLQKDGALALAPSIKVRFLISSLAAAFSWFPTLIVCTHIGLAPVANLIRKVTGIPYWVVLYGIEVWGNLPPSKLDAMRGAQRLVSITQFTLDAAIARHGLGSPRASLLPPTLSAPRSGSVEIDHAPGSGTSQPMVLTVGRMAASERYKGHDVMLDAWPIVLRRVPSAVYWIVGDGDDRPRLQARARDLGLEGSVHFTGPVSAEELDLCYDRCRIFSMPARTDLSSDVPRGEGFGIVFLEAMARGKAVVGPRVGAPAEFIHSGEHGLLVDPENSTEVAAALIELLEDPLRARRMGESGKNWVAQEFSFDRFCERLRAFLFE
jgi:phosphatidyl-myo-inositol dimannoside synthase